MYHGGIDTFFGERLARSRPGARRSRSGNRCRRLGGSRNRVLGGLRRRRGSRGFGSRVDTGNQLTRHDGIAVALDDFDEHTSIGGRQLQHHLVGFNVDKIFVAGDSITHIFVPADQSRLGDGFGQLRNFDFDDHESVS